MFCDRRLLGPELRRTAGLCDLTIPATVRFTRASSCRWRLELPPAGWTQTPPGGPVSSQDASCVCCTGLGVKIPEGLKSIPTTCANQAERKANGLLAGLCLVSTSVLDPESGVTTSLLSTRAAPWPARLPPFQRLLSEDWSQEGIPLRTS